MTAPHRQFEKLVARIEGTLAPQGAVVKSPDWLRDVITGELREVDASIRFKVGSVEILITVECRDRVRVEDVTWIEQLATKQKHIAASHTIAVSSTGFSAPALTAAALHGISTRTIEDVTDAEILAWAEKLEVDEIYTECELGRMSLIYFDGVEGGVQLDAPSLQLWNEQGWDAPIFVANATGERLSLAGLLAMAYRSQRSARSAAAIRLTIPAQGRAMISGDSLAALIGAVPPEQGKVQKTVKVAFERADVAAHTTAGLLSIRELAVEITAVSSAKRVPTARVLTYANRSGPVGYFAERQVQIGPSGQELVITQHRTPVSSEDSEETK